MLDETDTSTDTSTDDGTGTGTSGGTVDPGTGPAADAGSAPGTAEPAPPTAKKAAKRTTRTRRTAAATAAPDPAADSATADQPAAADQPVEGGADPDGAVAPTAPAKKAAAKRAPRKTAAKRATKKAAAVPEATEEPAEEIAGLMVPPAAEPTGEPTAEPSAGPAQAATSLLFQPPDPSAATTPARRRRRSSTTPAAATAPAIEGIEATEATRSAGEPEVTAPEDGTATETSGELTTATGAAADEADTVETAEPSQDDDTEDTGDTEDTEDTGDTDDTDDTEEDQSGGPRRRRRRGGRRRRRGEGSDNGGRGDDGDDGDAREGAAEAETTVTSEPSQDSSAAGAKDEDRAEGEGSGSRRRRRRRRTGDDGEGSTEDQSGQQSGGGSGQGSGGSQGKARKPRNAEDEITSLSGSTRLEAKKQRRREGREAGRRRAPIVSEAEFLARRESVDRVMVIRQRDDLTQIAVLEDKVLVEHYVARESQTSLIGNVYLGRVQNVLPSMEAAFIDIGKGRNAVLYAGEVNWDTLGAGNGPRKIEQVLKSGQSILVQVTKDPIGHKGARLTSQVSLPGRFLVYVPDGTTSGISRKLPDTERNRLKTLLKEIVPESAGVIVRTAAEGASEEELTHDVERLTARWADIESKIAKGNAPQLLYGEPDLTLKVVRDLFTEDFGRLVVSGDEAWEMVDSYVKHVAPDLEQRLERWAPDDRGDVFSAYRIDEQIAKGLDRKVWLPSGGSLIVDRTEAMTVVDVNTGKFTGSGGNLEETVTKNNLEAAEEIVRQLRLRDIGGIIVVDFIDMVLEGNRDLVLRRLVECLGRDRTRHQVAEVTSLGLVQMTRKRIGTGLLEAFSETCEHCLGRGLVLHHEPVEPRKGGSDDEPRRGRRGRGRGEQESAGSGRGSGNGAAVPVVKHAPTPADLAALAKQESRAPEHPEQREQPAESGPAETGLAEPGPAESGPVPAVDAAGELTAAPVVAAATQPEPPSGTEPEPLPETEPEPLPDVEPAPEPEPSPPVPTGPRLVTTSRRRVARRPAGPPAPATEPADSSGSTGAAHGANGAAHAGGEADAVGSGDAGDLDQAVATDPVTEEQPHVPVKRRSRKR